MRFDQIGAVIALPSRAATAGDSVTCSFDTRGFEAAQLNLNLGTHHTGTQILSAIAFNESDTLTTHASMTAITDLTGHTADVGSGFVIPAASTTRYGDTVLQFNIDLRKRKRYLSVSATRASGVEIGGNVLLSRPKVSADTAALKSIPNLASSTAGSCALVVNA